MIRGKSGIPYTTVRGLMDRGHKVGFERRLRIRSIYGMISVKFIMELLKVEKTVKQLNVKELQNYKRKLIHLAFLILFILKKVLK